MPLVNEVISRFARVVIKLKTVVLALFSLSFDKRIILNEQIYHENINGAVKIPEILSLL